VPWFWSDQGELNLQIAGLSQGHDQVVVRSLPEKARFAAVYFGDGRMTAIDALNWLADFMAARKHLAAGVALRPEDVQDPILSLKSLATAAGWR
jgi:3-phenylpropionate/trans-cinnamate dioxygenase ferredoxin reductase subunit